MLLKITWSRWKKGHVCPFPDKFSTLWFSKAISPANLVLAVAVDLYHPGHRDVPILYASIQRGCIARVRICAVVVQPPTTLRYSGWATYNLTRGVLTTQLFFFITLLNVSIFRLLHSNWTLFSNNNYSVLVDCFRCYADILVFITPCPPIETPFYYMFQCGLYTDILEGNEIENILAFRTTQLLM